MRVIFLLIFLLILQFSSHGQSREIVEKKLTFKQLTFLSSECKNHCPIIFLNLYSNSIIEISRKIFLANGEVNKDLTGNFKGYLEETSFSKLIELIETVNWDMPIKPDTAFCDLPIRTIILSYKEGIKKFKSACPPFYTIELINYLTKLCSIIPLPKYLESIDFESID